MVITTGCTAIKNFLLPPQKGSLEQLSPLKLLSKSRVFLNRQCTDKSLHWSRSSAPTLQLWQDSCLPLHAALDTRRATDGKTADLFTNIFPTGTHDVLTNYAFNLFLDRLWTFKISLGIGSPANLVNP